MKMSIEEVEEEYVTLSDDTEQEMVYPKDIAEGNIKSIVVQPDGSFIVEDGDETKWYTTDDSSTYWTTAIDHADVEGDVTDLLIYLRHKHRDLFENKDVSHQNAWMTIASMLRKEGYPMATTPEEEGKLCSSRWQSLVQMYRSHLKLVKKFRGLETQAPEHFYIMHNTFKDIGDVEKALSLENARKENFMMNYWLTPIVHPIVTGDVTDLFIYLRVKHKDLFKGQQKTAWDFIAQQLSEEGYPIPVSSAQEAGRRANGKWSNLLKKYVLYRKKKLKRNNKFHSVKELEAAYKVIYGYLPETSRVDPSIEIITASQSRRKRARSLSSRSSPSAATSTPASKSVKVVVPPHPTTPRLPTPIPSRSRISAPATTTSAFPSKPPIIFIRPNNSSSTASSSGSPFSFLLESTNTALPVATSSQVSHHPRSSPIVLSAEQKHDVYSNPDVSLDMSCETLAMADSTDLTTADSTESNYSPQPQPTIKQQAVTLLPVSASSMSYIPTQQPCPPRSAEPESSESSPRRPSGHTNMSSIPDRQPCPPRSAEPESSERYQRRPYRHKRRGNARGNAIMSKLVRMEAKRNRMEERQNQMVTTLLERIREERAEAREREEERAEERRQFYREMLTLQREMHAGIVRLLEHTVARSDHLEEEEEEEVEDVQYCTEIE